MRNYMNKPTTYKELLIILDKYILELENLNLLLDEIEESL